ncbi:hypothetical protein Poly51_60630 [Rubripirellula tenax]|uniref:Uncharacterized protein n=1 Tax=Rubripirellula tenax TaxID=2528015 RepID=A0A5C6E9A8_9BACT|nr:hypothetical protein Poly51_60630 [Rubripirellula tenax]
MGVALPPLSAPPPHHRYDHCIQQADAGSPLGGVIVDDTIATSILDGYVSKLFQRCAATYSLTVTMPLFATKSNTHSLRFRIVIVRLARKY